MKIFVSALCMAVLLCALTAFAGALISHTIEAVQDELECLPDSVEAIFGASVTRENAGAIASREAGENISSSGVSPCDDLNRGAKEAWQAEFAGATHVHDAEFYLGHIEAARRRLCARGGFLSAFIGQAELDEVDTLLVTLREALEARDDAYYRTTLAAAREKLKKLARSEQLTLAGVI